LFEDHLCQLHGCYSPSQRGGDLLQAGHTVGGLLGIALDPDSVSVRVGERLQFSNVTFDQFAQSLLIVQRLCRWRYV